MVDKQVTSALTAGTLFGLYLYASSRWLNLDYNDAFSSIRLDSHRNFLRLRIKGDDVNIYPIGLDRRPERKAWRFNTNKSESPAPVYVPGPPLKPHLIEGPIQITASNAH
jgi:hypothetical protein